MDYKSAFSFHKICMTALFVLGNWVITMPFLQNDSFSLGLFLLSFSLTVFLLPWVFLATKHILKTICKFQKAQTIIFCVVALILIFVSYKSAAAFLKFAKAHILPESQRWLLSAIFCFLLYVFSVTKNHCLFKVSLILAGIIIFVLMLFFFLSLPRFDFQDILKREFSLSGFSLFSVLGFSLKIIATCLIPMVFLYHSDQKSPAPKVFFGSILGVALLFLAYSNAVLIFSNLNALDFPYADAISTVSIGSLFTRMDGFAYLVFLVCALIKCTVCAKCALGLSKKKIFKNEKFFCGVFSFSVFLLSVI